MNKETDNKNAIKLLAVVVLCIVFGGLKLPMGGLSEDATVVLIFMVFLGYYLGNFVQEVRERLTNIEEKLKK